MSVREVRPEYRFDGWPLCPRCGQDELWSARVPADPKGPLTCYRCQWAGLMPAAPTPVKVFGFQVCVDDTLCDPGEAWIVGPDGEAVRVWPPAGKP